MAADISVIYRLAVVHRHDMQQIGQAWRFGQNRSTDRLGGSNRSNRPPRSTSVNKSANFLWLDFLLIVVFSDGEDVKEEGEGSPSRNRYIAAKTDLSLGGGRPPSDFYNIVYNRDLPSQDDDGQVLPISSLWNTAMAHPNDPEFIELGIFECMAALIWKGLKYRRWLSHDQNIYIPYYAAHIIGSYTNMEDFAETAVNAGVIPPLGELLKGSLLLLMRLDAADAARTLADAARALAAAADDADF
ncbi:armadillo-like helical domain-containing protein [Tanacetum coccineum]